MLKVDAQVVKAHQEVVKALQHSHAPYSGLHVAAAIKLKNSEQWVSGVNVENASYGGTICAERSAIVSAISQFGKTAFDCLIIISDAPGDSPIPPCGICLQVIKEFVGPDFDIYLGDAKHITRHLTLKDLLPQAFSGEMLPNR